MDHPRSEPGQEHAMYSGGLYGDCPQERNPCMVDNCPLEENCPDHHSQFGHLGTEAESD